MEHKAKKNSEWRVGEQPAISGLDPTVHEKHGCEQRSTIALKLIFGYLNCKPTNNVVKYSTEGGGDCLLGTKKGSIVEKIP